MLFHGEEGGNFKGFFWKKVHWRVQGDDTLSMAELQESPISCRRYNVHLFLWGLVIDDYFLLRILLLRIVAEISVGACNCLPVIDVESISSLPALLWWGLPLLIFIMYLDLFCFGKETRTFTMLEFTVITDSIYYVPTMCQELYVHCI